MKLTSSRSIFEANTDKEALDAIGWTTQHTDLRDAVENSQELVERFEALLTQDLRDLLRDVDVAISSGDAVRVKWGSEGLEVPYSVYDPAGVTIQAGDDVIIVFDVDVIARQGDDAIAAVIVHELKHYEQVKSGRMVMKKDAYIWHGEHHASTGLVTKSLSGHGVYGMAFMQCILPWEVEAYEAAYDYAVAHGFDNSQAIKHTFPIALAKALARWRAGEYLRTSEFKYERPLLSREGVFGIGIAKREHVRNNLIEGLSELAKHYNLDVDQLASETILSILNVDFADVMGIMIGYGIGREEKTGFFGELIKDAPVSYFTEEAYAALQQLAAEGK